MHKPWRVSRLIVRLDSAVAARRRMRRSVRRHRDLLWITVVVQASFLEATPADAALLVIPADWSVSGQFDRATLLGIRGWVSIVQATVGTSADATGAYAAIYKTDQSVSSGAFDPSDATDYSDFDVLYTDGICVNATSSPTYAARQLEVKTRRKLTSADSVRVALTLDADSATPRVNMNGVVRTLLQLDPAR